LWGAGTGAGGGAAVAAAQGAGPAVAGGSGFFSNFFTVPEFTLGNVLTGAGIVSSAFGQQAQGQQYGAQAGLQAELYRREAERQKQLSAADAADFSRKAKRLLASQRALQGGTGARVGTGTHLDLSEDTAAEAEYQRLKILSGGEATESRLLTQAGLTQYGGRAQRRLANQRTGATLLRGAGQLFGA